MTHAYKKEINLALSLSSAARPHGTIWIKVKPMPKIDDYELEVLSAFEKGQLKSVATKAELAKFKAAARATSGR